MRLTRRVLPLLQLTRMALVFTAIADSLCALFLRSSVDGFTPTTLLVALVVLISVGLYGFGMALNDVIDRRRDALIASHRPLPSGRIGVTAAHGITAALVALALAAGALFANTSPAHGWRSFCLVFFICALITFYDFAGKYLVAPGLLTLGLIRFFHAAVPAPSLPVLWHPLLLLNHVTILSAVAYRWEEKRPALTRSHWTFVLAGLATVDALVIAAVYARRIGDGAPLSEVLSLTPGLLLPTAAAIAFVGVAAYLRRTSPTSRDAGQKLMLFGLLWLIVYDASFLVAYDRPLPAAAVACLLPIAYFSVRIMRAWSKLTALSHRPDFKRA